MSNRNMGTNTMVDALKQMGIDFSKLNSQTSQKILSLAEKINDPENMTLDHVREIQETLGMRKKQPTRRTKIPVNSKCPCQSGKKYKKCCMKK